MSTRAIKMPHDIRITDVVELLAAAGDASSVHLDLSDLWRADREAAMLLSSALMTRLGNTALTVTPPSYEVLVRYGLMFAFAHRPGPTEFVGKSALESQSHLPEWRRSWTPGSRQQWLPLASEDTSLLPDEPSVSRRKLAAFVNPHLVPRIARGPRVSQVVRPWLLTLLPRRARVTLDPRAGLEFTDDLGRAVDELVDNVGCHAVGDKQSARSVASAVFILIARGNAETVRDRIYVVVLDTGPGILGTARPKFGDLRLRDTDLLPALFQEHHRELGRARGFGLPDVFRVAKRWRGGTVNCLTNGLRLTLSTSESAVSPIGADIGGTIVTLTIPTPPDFVAGDHEDMTSSQMSDQS
jgi:hypothetical protein